MPKTPNTDENKGKDSRPTSPRQRMYQLLWSGVGLALLGGLLAGAAIAEGGAGAVFGILIAAIGGLMIQVYIVAHGVRLGLMVADFERAEADGGTAGDETASGE